MHEGSAFETARVLSVASMVARIQSWQAAALALCAEREEVRTEHVVHFSGSFGPGGLLALGYRDLRRRLRRGEARARLSRASPMPVPGGPPIPVAQHPRVVLDGSRFICLECGRFAALSRGRKAWGDIPCRRVRGFVRRTAHLVVHDLGARAHQVVVEVGRMSCTACLRSVLVGGHHRFLRSFCRAVPHA